MRGNGCLLPTCWMRQLLRATLVLDATLLALLLHVVAVVSAAGEHPSQGDSGGEYVREVRACVMCGDVNGGRRRRSRVYAMHTAAIHAVCLWFE